MRVIWPCGDVLAKAKEPAEKPEWNKISVLSLAHKEGSKSPH